MANIYWVATANNNWDSNWWSTTATGAAVAGLRPSADSDVYLGYTGKTGNCIIPAGLEYTVHGVIWQGASTATLGQLWIQGTLNVVGTPDNPAIWRPNASSTSVRTHTVAATGKLNIDTAALTTVTAVDSVVFGSGTQTIRNSSVIAINNGIEGTAATSVTTVENCSVYSKTAAITISSGVGGVTNCLLSTSSYYTVRTTSGRIDCTDCVVVGLSHAIYTSYGTVEITESTIIASGGSLLYTAVADSTSKIILAGENTLVGAYQIEAISIGYKDNPSIRHITHTAFPSIIRLNQEVTFAKTIVSLSDGNATNKRGIEVAATGIVHLKDDFTAVGTPVANSYYMTIAAGGQVIVDGEGDQLLRKIPAARYELNKSRGTLRILGWYGANLTNSTAATALELGGKVHNLILEGNAVTTYAKLWKDLEYTGVYQKAANVILDLNGFQIIRAQAEPEPEIPTVTATVEKTNVIFERTSPPVPSGTWVLRVWDEYDFYLEEIIPMANATVEIQGFTPLQSYFWQAKAVNAAGMPSDWTNVSSFVPPAPKASAPSGITLTDLSANSVTATVLTDKWTVRGTVQIQNMTLATGWTAVRSFTVTPDTRSVAVSGLLENNQYKIRANAQSQTDIDAVPATESDWTESIVFTTVSTPPVINSFTASMDFASGSRDDGVLLNIDFDDKTHTWSLERRLGAGAWLARGTFTATVTSVFDFGTVGEDVTLPNTTYEYRARAANLAGAQGEYSAIVTGRTLPARPTVAQFGDMKFFQVGIGNAATMTLTQEFITDTGVTGEAIYSETNTPTEDESPFRVVQLVFS